MVKLRYVQHNILCLLFFFLAGDSPVFNVGLASYHALGDFNQLRLGRLPAKLLPEVLIPLGIFRQAHGMPLVINRHNDSTVAGRIVKELEGRLEDCHLLRLVLFDEGFQPQGRVLRVLNDSCLHQLAVHCCLLSLLRKKLP